MDVRSTSTRSDNPAGVSTEQVWKHLEKASFAVISHVTPGGEPRSSGVLAKAIPGLSQDNLVLVAFLSPVWIGLALGLRCALRRS